jgi:hypothetical protein
MALSPIEVTLDKRSSPAGTVSNKALSPIEVTLGKRSSPAETGSEIAFYPIEVTSENRTSSVLIATEKPLSLVEKQENKDFPLLDQV